MTTVRQALMQASEILNPVTEEARLDASLLLCHCLEKPRSWLIAHDDTELSSQQLEQFETLYKRRAQGEPLAYITGEKEFWSLTLKVGPGVLVPRPDTELLVETALKKLDNASTRILDLGTGSGAIACALASERPDSEVIATDVSEAALGIARQNVAALRLENVKLLASDWFNALDAQPFAVIVSNPPYVEKQDPHLAALKHEPLSALTAGPDGLDDLRVITHQAIGHLTDKGWLLVEHGATQGAAVRQLFEDGGFAEVSTRKDLAGLERVTLGQKP